MVTTGRLPGVIVDAAAYLDGKRQTGSLGLDELAGWLDRTDAFVWVGLRMPSREEVAQAFGALGLPASEVDAALTDHRRPVLSRCGDAHWLVLRTARYDDVVEQVYLGELSLLVGERFVLSVRHGQASPLNGLRDELERQPDVLTAGPAVVAARIVHQVIDDYAPALDGFENDAIEVERAVFGDARGRQPIQRLYQLKREVRRLLLVFDALTDPLARFAATESLGLPATVLLRENLENLRRVSQRTHALDDLLTSALGAAMAQVSMQQNEDMRRISAWVAIAAVPTMMAGVYGMNFDHMPELSWRFGYPLAVGLMAGVCGALYRVFRRSGWL
jgi:magnesium transporter